MLSINRLFEILVQQNEIKIIMLNKNDKKFTKVELWVGFIAFLCCAGPLVLIVLGIGGVSTALAIGKQSLYFLVLGVLFLIVVLGISLLLQRIKK